MIIINKLINPSLLKISVLVAWIEESVTSPANIFGIKSVSIANLSHPHVGHQDIGKYSLTHGLPALVTNGEPGAFLCC